MHILYALGSSKDTRMKRTGRINSQTCNFVSTVSTGRLICIILRRINILQDPTIRIATQTEHNVVGNVAGSQNYLVIKYIHIQKVLSV